LSRYEKIETFGLVCIGLGVAGPEQVLEYVGRYTHRVAISNNRPLDIEDGTVRFRWKDYRDRNRQKIMTVSADEFIRRFLLHVLPEGFHRVRYYGFLGHRHRAEKLARCRELLRMPIPKPLGDQCQKDYREHYEELTGVSLKQCPVCHKGQMITIETIESITIRPSIWDTS
jgi:hypothetical protein